MKKDAIKKIVRQKYAQIARTGSSCCGPVKSCGCSPAVPAPSKLISNRIGYSDKEMDSVPEGANLGLGCGNPIALASLKKGETVLDLGSGAGFDCFLAAKKVGPTGKVIGVDMTAEMLKKARANAKKGHYTNVEFRKGEIEKLPIESNSIDIIISNCVINLSPEKDRVFKEAFRVLKPGGRLMVSDIVMLNPLPSSLKKSISAYVGCLAGAAMKNEYLGTIANAEFQRIKVLNQSSFSLDYMDAKSIIGNLRISSGMFKKAVISVVSMQVSATKP